MDIIKLLPDAVANQIAAGEVVQRPASVVKELLENAVDSGATDIQLIVKDAGRTLIQVIDNGKGMSFKDARLCFERHATSKLRSADDLFHITTKGFRGEALASIAAIAHVELKTKPAETEDKSEYVDIYAHSSARKEAEDARKKEAAAAAEPEKKAESAKEERPIPEKPELKRPDSETTEDKKSSEDRLSRYLNDDDFDTNDDSDTPVRKYSDEDIERLLAETEGR